MHIKTILDEIKDHCKESGYPVRNVWNGTMSNTPVVVIVFKKDEVDHDIFSEPPQKPGGEHE